MVGGFASPTNTLLGLSQAGVGHLETGADTQPTRSRVCLSTVVKVGLKHSLQPSFSSVLLCIGEGGGVRMKTSTKDAQ